MESICTESCLTIRPILYYRKITSAAQTRKYPPMIRDTNPLNLMDSR